MCFAAQASPGLLSLRGATRSWPTALGPDGSACFSWWWSFSTGSRGARNPSGLQGWRCAGHSASLVQVVSKFGASGLGRPFVESQSLALGILSGLNPIGQIVFDLYVAESVGASVIHRDVNQH